MRLSFPHPLLVWSGHVESTGKYIDKLFTTTYLITYYIVFGLFWLWHVLQCFVYAVLCKCTKQYNGGLLPDIILLTQCHYHRGTRLNAMKKFCFRCLLWSHLSVLIFFPLCGNKCSEGLNAFRFFFKTVDFSPTLLHLNLLPVLLL